MPKLIDITGKAISGEWGQEALEGKGIPVLRTTNFTNEGIIKYDDVVTRHITKKNIADKMLRKGDIIIEKSGGSDKQPVGRVVYFEGEENKFLFNNFTGLLRVKDTKKWMPRYVFYSLYGNYINGGTKAFENRTTGLHNLQTDNYVMSTEVRDVTLDEQDQIVKQLDSILELIAKHRKQLEFLDVLVKSRFIELFIKKNFPKVEIGSILTQCTSVEKIQDTKKEIFVTVGLRGAGARQRIIKDGKWPVPFSGYRVKSGQFIYSRIDARNGAFAILSSELNDAVVSKDFPVFIIDDEQILPCVLLSSVLENGFIEQIQSSSFGATNRQRIKEDVFLKYIIPLAPMNIQKEFECFVTQVDKSKHFSELEVAA